MDEKDIKKSFENNIEFQKILNSCFTITLGERSNGKKSFYEALGYKVITLEKYKRIKNEHNRKD